MYRIAKIEDVSFLNALKTTIETKTKSIIQLTNEQRNEIVESKRQNGKGQSGKCGFTLMVLSFYFFNSHCVKINLV